MQYIIGDGNNYYDFTYVENVAYGHVCAEKTLSSEDGAKIAAGKVKFSPGKIRILLSILFKVP